MVGHREGQMSKELKRAVPAAALLGGGLLGALAVVGDLTGALGGGGAVLVGGAAVQTFMAMGMVVRAFSLFFMRGRC
jgi:protein transport protein SEC61 subunit alpha